MINFFKKLNKKYIRLKLGWSPQQNLFYGFLTYVFVGFLLLCIPWLENTDVPILDHLFTTVSAVSTTGLVTVNITETYNFFGQFVIMILIQLGGIGYLTFTTFLILSTTRKMTHWHKKLLKSEFTLPSSIKIRDFLKSVVLFTLFMEFLGAILFLIAFLQKDFGFWEALWQAVFHSVSTFCTAGFSLFDSGFTAYVDDTYVNFIISFLSIAGSLGFIVVTDFVLWFKNKAHRLSFTTKIIIVGTLCLLAFGFVFFYFFEPEISQLDGKARLLAAFFQSMTAMTTVGFNTVDFGGFILPMILVTIFLMYIGTSPSGTAGGVKITTLTAVFAIMKSRIRGSRKITFLGRTIPFERLYIATSSFMFYTSILFLGTFLLSFTEDIHFEKILFEAASALGTVGLSTGITGDLSDWGKGIIILLMFIGRLGVLTFGLAIWSKRVLDEEKPIQEIDIAV